MSVNLRGRKFHYRFQYHGKSYSGPLNVIVPHGSSAAEIDALRLQAEREEKTIYDDIVQELCNLQQAEKEIRQNRSVRALVENYKYELTGGSPITLQEAFPLAAAKPSKRKSAPKYVALRSAYWGDFASFMAATYPEIVELSSVRRAHCEAYVSYLSNNGRFNKDVSFSMEGKRGRMKQITYRREYHISPKTIKEIAGVCHWVFSRLEEDAGIFSDPWKNVVLPASAPTPREIFSADELKLIWDGMQYNLFCRHLFMIAANSGMTEGDICTLKWEEVDWTANCIRRRRRKTGAPILLPMLPQLSEYLASLPREGEYVSPVHAEMYLRGPSGVSSRVTSFLEGLGIRVRVQIEGRRAQSVKDLHSMRHLFCYRAKRAGIPESIIMKFVGHEVLAMTQHYADHDTAADLNEDIKKLPALFAGELTVRDPRRELADLAYSLPLEQVERLLGIVQGVTA